MTIVEATEKYEKWVAAQMPIVESDLLYKHDQMAGTLFAFFRATYYRWAQNWSVQGGGLADAPETLSVGDLHIENFGTWRDSEGRLVWGINDFDEGRQLPYTNDLVRLAVSSVVAEREKRLAVNIADACEALLEGYERGLTDGGRPFVLEERHAELRLMAMNSFRDPQRFWQRMLSLDRAGGPAEPGASAAVASMMPAGCKAQPALTRRAGLGSLGKPRFVYIAEHEGGLLAREAKRLAGPAADWAVGKHGKPKIRYQALLDGSVRSKDPHVKVVGDWLVRRLAPHCSRISLEDWPGERQEIVLIQAMGFETANVHLGSPKVTKEILRDLRRRPKKWLRKAAESMAASVEADADAWRRSRA